MGTSPQANAKRKADALAEKEQGNAAYKKKDFQSAVQHYDRALELYEGDISFLTNRCAIDAAFDAAFVSQFNAAVDAAFASYFDTGFQSHPIRPTDR